MQKKKNYRGALRPTLPSVAPTILDFSFPLARVTHCVSLREIRYIGNI